MAYCVTSEPVPAVVGISTTGSAFAEGSVKRISASASGFAVSTAMALEASIGEPPPIPMTKSTASFFASSAARTTVSTSGFSPISSNNTHCIPNASRASVTSCWEPFFFAEVLPVTIRAFCPSFFITSLCSAIQSRPKYVSTGIK